jgi:GAF domain-containing protein
MVLGELKRLPAPVQRTLTLAACLGNRFEPATLAMVGGQSTAVVQRHLGEVEAANLVAPLGRAGSPDKAYHFLHDRIQQAAYAALADERERAAIHLRVGRSMLAGREGPGEGQLFDLVDHLNRGRPLIDDPQELLQLAELNLEAGRRAKDSVAYASALAYLERGVALLPEGAWMERHALAYALHKDLLECQYLCGAIEQAQDTAGLLLRHVRDRLERAEVQSLRMILATALNRMNEVLELGYPALRDLGVRLPRDPAAVRRAQRLETWRIQRRLLGRPIASLAEGPPLRDPLQLARLNVMAQMIPALYYTDMESSHLVYLRMARLSMQHGHLPVTPIAYLGLGRYLGEKWGRFGQRRQFGEVGLQLAEHYGSQALLCKVLFLYGGFIHGWSDTAEEAADHLRRAFEAGMASGDLVWACYANNVMCMQLVFLGRPYTEIEAESQRCLDHARQVGEHYTPVFLLITRQMARCLQGRTRSATDLSDEEFEEAEQRALLEQRPEFRVALHWYQLCKTQVLLLAGMHREALAMARAAEGTRDAAMGMLQTAEDPFLQALCLAAVLQEEGDPALRRIYGDSLRRLGRELQERAERCPANFRHRALLVRAEIAWLEGRSLQAQPLFGQAIQAALEAGHEPLAAYGHTRAAALHRSLADPVAARAHAEEARSRQARLGRVVKEGAADSALGPASGLLGRSLDLHSLIESLQALSREILLDRLLDRIVGILLANAGAERVVLVLEDGDQALIQAEGRADPRRVEVLQARPLAESLDLPLSIVRMVRRLRRPLVLADAAAEGEFRHDPRVMAAGLRSVLCLPLTLQSQVLGVVYLENNLASNVFGSLRLETIEILGTQLAISLENARLYGEMARINRSYGRFIPHEFLSFLGRDSILDVQLGDQVLKRMTVLFADIREFTAISERLTPKESFDFLNGYLRRVGPIVRLHNGFIDKYIGDAVMALFPGTGADAVRAALAIQREVAAYNRERGAMDAEPLRIGIGIHTGDLMLGTVGEEERMESTVISDAVNLATGWKTSPRPSAAASPSPPTRWRSCRRRCWSRCARWAICRCGASRCR